MSDYHGLTHRATVLVANDTGVFLDLPALAPGASWGPIPSAVPGLAPGDAVLAMQIGPRVDDLVVTQRVPGRWPTQDEIAGLTAALAALNTQVAANTSDISIGVGEISTLQGQMTAANANIAANASAIAANTANIASQGNRITALEGLRHRSVFVTATVSTNNPAYNNASSGDDVSLTMPYPPSGIMTVHVHASITTATAANYGMMSIEIRDTNVSGTQRKAAADNGVWMQSYNAGNAPGGTGGAIFLTGLPTTGTAFVRAMYRSTTTDLAYFGYRGITAVPSP